MCVQAATAAGSSFIASHRKLSQQEQFPSGWQGLVFRACATGHTETLDFLVQRGFAVARASSPKIGVQAVHIAAHYGHIDCLEWLVARGAKLEVADTQQCNAMHYAAEGGSVDMAEYLSEKGLHTCAAAIYGHR
jgi:ankyrin repeat protein